MTKTLRIIFMIGEDRVVYTNNDVRPNMFLTWVRQQIELRGTISILSVYERSVK